MSEEKWELCPYKNKDGRWIPRVRVFPGKKDGKEEVLLDAGEMFDYAEKKEAEKHGVYLAKDYLARTSK